MTPSEFVARRQVMITAEAAPVWLRIASFWDQRQAPESLPSNGLPGGEAYGVLRDLVALTTLASIKIALLYCLNVLLPRRVVGWLPEVTKRLAARRQQEFLTLNECFLDLFSRAAGNTSW